MDKSCGWAGNFLSMADLRKKILRFRDIIDLPLCDANAENKELLMGTVEDLHTVYPKIVTSIHISEIDETSVYEVFSLFYNALKAIGNSWAESYKWLSKFRNEKDENIEDLSLEQFVERVVAEIDYMIRVAKELFDVMDEDGHENKGIPESSMSDEILCKSDSNKGTSSSPFMVTPTSVLSNMIKDSQKNERSLECSYSPPRLSPLRLKAVGKLMPINIKHLSIQIGSTLSPLSSTIDKNTVKVAPDVKPQTTVIKKSEGFVVKALAASRTPTVLGMNVSAARAPAPSVLLRNSFGQPPYMLLAHDSPSYPLPILAPNAFEQAPPPPPSLMLAPNEYAPSPLPPCMVEPNASTPSPLQMPQMLAPNASETSTSPSPMLVSHAFAPHPEPTLLMPDASAPFPSPLPILIPNASAPSPSSAILVVPDASAPIPLPTSLLVLDDSTLSPSPMSLLAPNASRPSPSPPAFLEPDDTIPSSSPPPLLAPNASVPSPSPPAFSAPDVSAPSLPSSVMPDAFASFPSLPALLAIDASAPSPSPPPTLVPNASVSAPVPSVVHAVKSTPLKTPLLVAGAKGVGPPPLVSGAKGVGQPPPVPGAKGVGPPPPLMPGARGVGPPPPPFLGGPNSLRPKKPNTKLKRSPNMANLNRALKSLVEGTSLESKPSNRGGNSIGASGGSKQSMADALEEMKRGSPHYKQIQEDVLKHSKSINEMKTAISSFQTKDMTEMLKFHEYVELHLRSLTDESQVLARFDDFPTKKLETLRTATSHYLKLNAVVKELKNWLIEAPLDKSLAKIESYFNKIKKEIEALERTKDEEAKRFQSHKIEFDFDILIRIKEAMVDVSSDCIELALKEARKVKEGESGKLGPKAEARFEECKKMMLWTVFKFAVRVCTFAGGQDDRAERLTEELGREIKIIFSTTR